MTKFLTLSIVATLVFSLAVSCKTSPKQAAEPAKEEAIVQKPVESEPVAEELVKQPEPLPPAEEPKPAPVAEDGRSVYFAPLSYTLDETAMAKLKLLAEDIKAKSAKSIKVTGHSAKLDTTREEDTLALKRAVAVAKYLVSLGVVANDDVMVESSGAQSPAAPHSDISGRWLNRRVEIVY